MKQKDIPKNQEKTKKRLYFGFLQGLDKNNKKEYNSIRNLSSLYRRKLRAWLRHFLTLFSSIYRLLRRKGIIMDFSMFRFNATAGGVDNRRGRFATTLLAFIFAVFLTACGGGGGGGGTTPAPITCPTGQVLSGGLCVTPAPTATDVKWPFANGDTLKFDKNKNELAIAFTFTTSGATSVDGTVTVTDNGTAVSGVVTTWQVSNNVATTSATIPVAYGKTYAIAVKAKAHGPGGDSTELSSNTTFKTEKEPAWWPPKFVPQGTKVYLDSKTAPAGAVTNATYPGQTESGLLPPECRIVGDNCWHEAVRNGTLSTKTTTARNLLQPDRPIAWVHYKTIDTIAWPGQNKKLWCLTPVFADDGTTVKKNPPVEDVCSSDEQTWSITNDLGVLYQEKNSLTGVSACYQKLWDNIFLGWKTIEATCP
jgi:hypothetical protein